VMLPLFLSILKVAAVTCQGNRQLNQSVRLYKA